MVNEWVEQEVVARRSADGQTIRFIQVHQRARHRAVQAASVSASVFPKKSVLILAHVLYS